MRTAPLLWGAVAAVLAGNASATEVALLPPHQVTRETGGPQVFRLDFVALPGLPGTVRIQNGTAAGEMTVTAAVVRLNHRVVFPPHAFAHRAYELESLEGLEAHNVLEVEIRGRPGSHLTVSATQDVPAHGAAVVGAGGGFVEVVQPSSVIRGARLEVPPGALAGPVLIRMNPAQEAPLFSDGAPGFSAIELQPAGLAFAVPARLTLPYEPTITAPAEHGDRGWLTPRGAMGKRKRGRQGITYVMSEQDKSALYLALLPVVNSGAVELLDVPELLRELRGLERRRGSSGRDRVDHRPGSHDDMANAVAGLASLLATARDPDDRGITFGSGVSF